jgi:hypothetical protein
VLAGGAPFTPLERMTLPPLQRQPDPSPDFFSLKRRLRRYPTTFILLLMPLVFASAWLSTPLPLLLLGLTWPIGRRWVREICGTKNCELPLKPGAARCPACAGTFAALVAGETYFWDDRYRAKYEQQQREQEADHAQLEAAAAVEAEQYEPPPE